jgi:hypothetical protein
VVRQPSIDGFDSSRFPAVEAKLTRQSKVGGILALAMLCT